MWILSTMGWSFKTSNETSKRRYFLRPLTQAVERSDVRYHEVADAVVGQRVGHAAEGRRPGRRSDQILQDEVPADEECHALAHSHVAVRVGRACGLWHPYAKLCVTHPWKTEWNHTHTRIRALTALSLKWKAKLKVLMGTLIYPFSVFYTVTSPV